MEQVAPDRNGLGRGPGRRRPIAWFVMALLIVAGVLAVALPLTVRNLGEPLVDQVPPLRPTPPPVPSHALSIDFGIVTDPATDWDAVAARLDQVNATTVDLNAGRVEFTAFDWPDHPEVAAQPGSDHLAVAARHLNSAPNGGTRQINLIVDAYVPEWIKSDPSIAGVDTDGRRSTYTASAAQLAEGEVGERLISYVAALGERYDPNQIQLTELFLDNDTFGEDDLALFEQMTGSSDWPRTDAGAIDTDAAEIGTWRSDVLAGLLGRIRAALDLTRDGAGRDISLALDVRVNWSDPGATRPLSGHDYTILLRQRIVLQLWVYIGRSGRTPADVEPLTADLRTAGFDMSRFIVSVGLWQGDISADPPDRLTPKELTGTVEAAETNGITAVNVTPYSLMTPDLWTALTRAWSG